MNVIALVIQYGLPAALDMVKMWLKHEPDNVAAQEWTALLEKVGKNYGDYIAEAEKKV